MPYLLSTHSFDPIVIFVTVFVTLSAALPRYYGNRLGQYTSFYWHFSKLSCQNQHFKVFIRHRSFVPLLFTVLLASVATVSSLSSPNSRIMLSSRLFASSRSAAQYKHGQSHATFGRYAGVRFPSSRDYTNKKSAGAAPLAMSFESQSSRLDKDAARQAARDAVSRAMANASAKKNNLTMDKEGFSEWSVDPTPRKLPEVTRLKQRSLDGKKPTKKFAARGNVKSEGKPRRFVKEVEPVEAVPRNM
jgi:hypothetical protein